MVTLTADINISSIFFHDWESVVRTLVIGLAAYIALILGLRVSGNRTLSKMNAFDFVVTIALGSILATILLSKQTALAEGLAAFALLIGLQYMVTWTCARASWVKRAVTGEPRLIFYNGQYLWSEMKRARITKEEVLSAARSAGYADTNRVGAVILETDGSCSVTQMDQNSANTSLQDVKPDYGMEDNVVSQPS